MTYRVGVARAVITAPLGTPCLAHRPRLLPLTGVHDDLDVVAWWIGDADTDAVLVTLDLIGLGRGLLPGEVSLGAALRRAIADRVGLPVDHVMVTATHTHACPETSGITRPLLDGSFVAWLEMLVDRVVGAAAAAREAARPVRLTTGLVRVPDVAVNRRHRCADGEISMTATPTSVPSSLVDESMTVLVADSEDGSSEVVVGFACHPVALQAQPRMSADYPGQLRRALERDGHGAMFVQGACGDVNPVDMDDGVASVERTASRLLDAARRGIATARSGPVVSGPLRCRDQPVRLAKRQDLARAPVPSVTPGEAAGETAGDAARDADADRNRDELLARLAPAEVPYESVVQVIRIGTVAICALPGEPFTELGLLIRAMSPAGTTVVAGYANDYLGYLAPPAAWMDGGYEVACGPWTLVDGSAARLLCTTTHDLLHTLWSPSERS